MGDWYRVVKTIKGHKYIYEQQTFREGGRVRTRNRYLGPADTGSTSSRATGKKPAAPTPPLFHDTSDFTHALIEQFDAPKWGEDTSAQLFGITTHKRSVTTTPAGRQPAYSRRRGAHATQAEDAKPLYSPRDVQAEITNKIITAIETGQTNGTFQMPWHAIAGVGLPVNTVTHQPYHGVNSLLLSLEAAEHQWPNHWASFAQWKERRASVRKGEHGVPIVFYSPIPIQEIEEDAEGNKKLVVKTIPVFHYSTVFNIAQVDNSPLVTPPPPDLVNPIEKAEQFISSTKANIRYGGNSAYYSPSSDYIQMPPREAFTGTKTSSPTEAFYGVLLHELCHWTGGKSRLNRDNHNRFGDEAYAAEELVALSGQSAPGQGCGRDLSR